MCTTGAKILRPGKEFVLFKNRDFKRAGFDDRLTLTDRYFGVQGLETWDGLDPSQDRFSGFSIGFNSALACCDSNGRTIPGGENYDLLVQAVVETCMSLDEAVERVRVLARDRTFCWANLIVATPSGVAALEVRTHEVTVDAHPTMIVRANHHLCGGSNDDFDDTVTTFVRHDLAHDGLMHVNRLPDLFPLLRSHAPGMDYGICNHGLYETVYSYVIHWNEGATDFYVYQGHPCAGGDYVKIPIRLGETTALTGYPSRYAI